ncbi:hypothetical protein H1R20_g6747, partial [Candolleomyces eurysporus]
MPSKISRTHNFSGNEVSSQMGPYDPGTYDPPQAYPVASSYTPSAVAADALMSGPPNPRPRSRNKLLKKISKHFTKPEPEAKPEPATAIIDWEAIVAETGSLSRYPALCTSSTGASLHAHPHKRLPERDTKHGRPNTESINDLGVMKNPSRTKTHSGTKTLIRTPRTVACQIRLAGLLVPLPALAPHPALAHLPVRIPRPVHALIHVLLDMDLVIRIMMQRLPTQTIISCLPPGTDTIAATVPMAIQTAIPTTTAPAPTMLRPRMLHQHTLQLTQDLALAPTSQLNPTTVPPIPLIRHIPLLRILSGEWKPTSHVQPLFSIT